MSDKDIDEAAKYVCGMWGGIDNDRKVLALLAELRALRAWKTGLHGRIGNITPRLDVQWGDRYCDGHTDGFRDARHAAAELVNEPAEAK